MLAWVAREEHEVDRAAGRLERTAGAARRLFSGADGREVLDALQREFFDGKLIGSTVEQTYANLGAREVVRYLRELRDYGTRKDGTT